MKKFSSFLATLLVLSSLIPLSSQKLIKNSSVTGICYAGNKVTRIYIPPPDEFYRKTKSKSGGSVTIYYTPGFSELSKPALEYAASILEKILPADTRLTILASWEKISTSGVLGQSSITGYASGWGIDALNPLAIYPVGLAEKISGEKLNSDLEGDLLLTINSSQPWYLGTDGQTPVGKFDLVTVALHEICHGLGFYDRFSTDGKVGWDGSGLIPIMYDTFIENNEGERLTDTSKFKNYSSALRSQLLGEQLYFNGPLLKNYCVLNNIIPSRAKLWAPPVWDPGSSISHLDENKTLQANSLMTPSIDFGEAIHDPGKYTFSILGDIGWINTRIVHKPMVDTEKLMNEMPISIEIKSDTLFDRNKVGVVFSYDKFQTCDTLIMTSTNSDNFFNTVINIPAYNTELQYHFFVEDCFSRVYSPLLFNYDKQSLEKFRYLVYIGADTVKPVISHTPADYYLETIDTIGIKVTATDNIAIDSVYLEYKVNNGPSEYLGLKPGKNDTFTANIYARPMNLNGGDSIKYRFFASDSALIANISVLPKEGFFVTKIEGISATVKNYSTDFANADADFFNVGFDISKPAGFSKFGLNTKHPYESSEDNSKSIEYTAMLRHPVELDESGVLISFNEIVLVEPGEAGTVFGDPDFYDYVIIEGSKNFGKTWFSLVNGYDSRYSPSWYAAYNSSLKYDSINGVDNSTFIGNESLLKKHTVFIHPSESVSVSDTLIIRFRLYSDPLTNGWGWVIEDLKINPLIDAVEKVSSDLTGVYPNPGSGLINIRTNISGIENIKPFHYSIFSSTGICIMRDRISEGSAFLADISSYPAGMYLIVLYKDTGTETIKYTMIK